MWWLAELTLCKWWIISMKKMDYIAIMEVGITILKFYWSLIGNYSKTMCICILQEGETTEGVWNTHYYFWRHSTKTSDKEGNAWGPDWLHMCSCECKDKLKAETWR
jgi:hypothetical protein